MADRGLVRLVLDDWNYWARALPESRVGRPRRLAEKIMRVATGREVVAITGVRRCGKTTILHQLISRLLASGVSAKSILLANLEDHRLSPDLSLGLLDDLVATWRQGVWPQGPGWVLLDEVQEVPQWERWVRTLYEQNPELRVVVTGSSSSLMAGELATLLTGRNLTFEATPLSFSEFLGFRGVDAAVQLTPELAFFEHRSRENELLYHLEDYLTIGGFPEVVRADSVERQQALLQQYFSDIVAKDVAFRHQIRETRTLKDLALLLLRQVGSPVSAGRLAQVLGTTPAWVLRMMGHLEDARLINLCRHFAFSMRQSIAVQKPRKVYAADLGMRNAVAPSVTPDRGHLAENALYQHLRSLGPVPAFWSGRREVDFVVSLPDLAGVNLTWADEVAQRETDALGEFQTSCHPQRTILATRTLWRPVEGNPPRSTLPLWAMLLAESL